MEQFSEKKKREEESLMNEIRRTQIALDAAYANFENVINPDLIDSYIYELNAVNKRYKFLLSLVKKPG